MNLLRHRVLPVATAVTAALALAACGSSSTSTKSSATTAGGGTTSPSTATPAISIGSANFPENEILADIYADALRAKGLTVTTHLNIGSREIYYKELQSGAINVFPEYNGALLAYLQPSTTASSTAQVDAALAKALPASLKALAPSSAQDKDSITVTQAFAKAHHLTSIASLKAIESQVTIGGPPEFQTRQAGLLGLKRLYGLSFKAFKALDEAGPLSIAALKDGTVQAADIFTTDPSVSADHFVALADPKHLFAVQNVVPIVNVKVDTSTVSSTLDAVSAALNTNNLIQLVGAVVNDHIDAAKVASEFVSQAKLG